LTRHNDQALDSLQCVVLAARSRPRHRRPHWHPSPRITAANCGPRSRAYGRAHRGRRNAVPVIMIDEAHHSSDTWLISTRRAGIRRGCRTCIPARSDGAERWSSRSQCPDLVHRGRSAEHTP
jgi:hypothetical protein